MKYMVVILLPMMTGCATLGAAAQVALTHPQAVEANVPRDNEVPEDNAAVGYLFMALSIATGGLL